MIPKRIFQTWKTKNLSPELQANVDRLKSKNPTYEYTLFDDDDCRKYLLDNFGERYVRAFDELNSGAFKADLWRYAILYKEGGVYIDMDMELLVPLDDIIQGELVSIADRKKSDLVPSAVYQAFIASVPNHPVLLHALDISTYNVLSFHIPDTDCTDITGPIVFGRALNIYWNKDSETPITEGKYGEITLYNVSPDLEYTYNLKNKRIMRNKIKDYDRGHIYWDNNYYKTKHTDHRNYIVIEKYKVRRLWYVLFIILFIGVVAFMVKHEWDRVGAV